MNWLRRWKSRILLFFAVIGPGFITANVDNDAGGIATYSQAGAQFGYALLWTMIPVTIALIVVQEMSARMGAVTGKGLSDLIREEFGFRVTFFIMIALVLVNLSNVMAEFAGVASSMELFGISKYISVPLAAALVWVLVVKGNYKLVEKVFLAASFFYFAYIFAGFFAKPDPEQLIKGALELPTLRHFRDHAYLYMVIGIVGATIAPWMQFYLQASVVEKGVTPARYGGTKLDVIAGSIFTDVVAAFIIIACGATIYLGGHRDIHDAADAAYALRPLAGDYAYILFGAGLFNASLFAASILPLSTAYSVCEGLGWESGLDKSFSEAPLFYWLYTLLIGLGAGVVLWPNFPLLRTLVLSQVLNGFLLPFILIFMLILVNRSELMGKYTNSRFFNVIAWGTCIAMIVMSVALIFGS
jgi:Mn2+/Fe2+ NRAMP family transporter